MSLTHHISGCVLSRGIESISSHVIKRKFNQVYEMYTNGPLNHSTSLLYMENHYISFQHVIQPPIWKVHSLSKSSK